MKKQIIIIGIVVILFAVGLSGCKEIDDQNIEIVDYSVTTHWHAGYGADWKEYVEGGFYHDIPSDATKYWTYYKISGTLKNVGGSKIDRIDIHVECYDENGVDLFDTSEYIILDWYRGYSVLNLPEGYTEDFSIEIRRYTAGDSCKYWDKIESFDFVISIT